jgi:hypothetical protein
MKSYKHEMMPIAAEHKKQTVNDVKSFGKQMFQLWTYTRMFRNVFFPSVSDAQLLENKLKANVLYFFFGS